jgi:adenylyl cyclase-associated protein
LNWNINAYENEKIVLTEEEAQMKHGIFIENSKNVTLKIEGKFKSIQVNKCESIVLLIKSCISGIEVMNCKDVQIFVKEKTPSVSVDKTERCRVILNENNLECDIVSSKASELNISYEKSDGN